MPYNLRKQLLISDKVRERKAQMPTVGARRVFKLVVRQTYGGQQVLNIFNFIDLNQILTETVDPVIAAGSFRDTAIIGTGDWRTLVNDLLTFDSIDFEEYDNPDVFGSIALGFTGDVPTATDNALPSFFAVGIQLNRTSKVVRNGAKRISGLVESQVTGQVITGTYQTAWINAASDFLNNISATSGGQVIAPCILGIRFDTTVTPPVRLPTSQWEFSTISGVEVKQNSTTQNSRKVGKGQ